jgi:hypothetical protein
MMLAGQDTHFLARHLPSGSGSRFISLFLGALWGLFGGNPGLFTNDMLFYAVMITVVPFGSRACWQLEFRSLS